MPTADPLDPVGPFARAVTAARERSGLPVVFAGRMIGGSLRTGCLRGNRSDALRGLSLPPDIGLGGRAVALGRPVSVRDYANAQAITHEHDIAVANEGLRGMLAVPVAQKGRVVAVLYGGVRAPVRLGDRVVDQVVAAARALAEDLAAPGAASAHRMPGRARLRELVEQLVADTRDSGLRAEVASTCDDLLAVLDGRAGGERVPTVTPRELAVLRLAAAGCADAEIAGRLGVAVGAVRSALRNVRRAFGVRSRHAAICAARSAGVLR